MKRWTWVLSAIAALVLVAVSSPVSTASQPQNQCGGPVKGRAWSAPGRSGVHYLVFVIGASYPCNAAIKWTLKLVNDNTKGSVLDSAKLKNGPTGYRCVGVVDNQNHPYSGFCIKGPQTNPTAGFDWDGSNG